MKYICLNPDCSKYQLPEEVIRESFVMRDGKLVGKNCICLECKKERMLDNPNEKIPIAEKGIVMGTYASMSKEQKREMLQKRSHEHFKKEIKERKDGLLNQAMSEMRNMHKR